MTFSTEDREKLVKTIRTLESQLVVMGARVLKGDDLSLDYACGQMESIDYDWDDVKMLLNRWALSPKEKVA